jgi:hypothetical protein
MLSQYSFGHHLLRCFILNGAYSILLVFYGNNKDIEKVI